MTKNQKYVIAEFIALAVIVGFVVFVMLAIFPGCAEGDDDDDQVDIPPGRGQHSYHDSIQECEDFEKWYAMNCYGDYNAVFACWFDSDFMTKVDYCVRIYRPWSVDECDIYDKCINPSE